MGSYNYNNSRHDHVTCMQHYPYNTTTQDPLYGLVTPQDRYESKLHTPSPWRKFAPDTATATAVSLETFTLNDAEPPICLTQSSRTKDT